MSTAAWAQVWSQRHYLGLPPASPTPISHAAVAQWRRPFCWLAFPTLFVTANAGCRRNSSGKGVADPTLRPPPHLLLPAFVRALRRAWCSSRHGDERERVLPSPSPTRRPSMAPWSSPATVVVSSMMRGQFRRDRFLLKMHSVNPPKDKCPRIPGVTWQAHFNFRRSIFVQTIPSLSDTPFWLAGDSAVCRLIACPGLSVSVCLHKGRNIQ